MKALFSLLLGAATILSTRAATNSPALPPIAPTFANVPYGPHERNVLDFWQAKSDAPAPLLVYIHGGGWRGGDKSTLPPKLLEFMLDHGMIWRAVGAKNRVEVQERYAEYRALYHEFSPINHVGKGDPPVLLLYPTPSPLPAPNPGTAIHHAVFGIQLKAKADAAGDVCVLRYADEPNLASIESNAFLLQHLTHP